MTEESPEGAPEIQFNGWTPPAPGQSGPVANLLLICPNEDCEVELEAFVELNKFKPVEDVTHE